MSDEELAEWLAVCDRPRPDGILMSRYTLRQILVEAERRGEQLRLANDRRAELEAAKTEASTLPFDLISANERLWRQIDAMRAVVEAAKRDRDEWFEGYCDQTDCVRCNLYRAVEAYGKSKGTQEAAR